MKKTKTQKTAPKSSPSCGEKRKKQEKLVWKKKNGVPQLDTKKGVVGRGGRSKNFGGSGGGGPDHRCLSGKLGRVGRPCRLKGAEVERKRHSQILRRTRIEGSRYRRSGEGRGGKKCGGRGREIVREISPYDEVEQDVGHPGRARSQFVETAPDCREKKKKDVGQC